MTNIKHHLTDDVLLAYCAGTLPEAFSLVVATHISLCETCRSHMDTLDALGGVVIEETPKAAMSSGSLEACLKMAESMPKDPIKMEAAGKPKRQKSAGLFPAPLQDYVGGDLDAVRWRPIGLGVKQAILKTSRDASVRLLYIPTGAAMPDHTHNGTEMTLVLQGAFQDESDYFGAGDVEIADEDMNHTPVAVGPVDCICLAASDAPLKFNGILPKVLQPFFRI